MTSAGRPVIESRLHASTPCNPGRPKLAEGICSRGGDADMVDVAAVYAPLPPRSEVPRLAIGRLGAFRMLGGILLSAENCSVGRTA